MAQFVSTFFKETTKPLTSALRPWSLFLDLSSLNLPSTIQETTIRVTQNAIHFSCNYSIILFTILSLALLNHPLVLIALFISLIAWLSLYFSRDDPLRVSGYQLSEWMVVSLLSFLTLLILVFGGVLNNVLIGGGIGVLFILLHAVLRSTDDLVADDIETSPYANLLSDDDEFNSPTGRGL